VAWRQRKHQRAKARVRLVRIGRAVSGDDICEAEEVLSLGARLVAARQRALAVGEEFNPKCGIRHTV